MSVLIPTYNRADLLKEAIESVLRQSRLPDEVVIVDDGSSDETAQTVREFGDQVRYHRQHHQGVAYARNKALSLAQSEWVAWLDSDDLWESQFLDSVGEEIARRGDADGIYTGLLFIDGCGRLVSETRRVVAPEALFDALVEANFLATPSLVARRACYLDVGGFDTQFSLAEDYDLWLRLAHKYRIYGLAEPLVKIRLHEENMMSDVDALAESELAIVEKYYGELTNGADQWSNPKRRGYAFAYRRVGTLYWHQSQIEAAREALDLAVSIWPEILLRLETYYELASGGRKYGYGGQVNQPELQRKIELILTWLDELFSGGRQAPKIDRNDTFGRAYLALAMVCERNGLWDQARHYIRLALKADRSLVWDGRVRRRLLKLHAGRQAIAGIRRITSRV